jgi:hypothetical protein
MCWSHYTQDPTGIATDVLHIAAQKSPYEVRRETNAATSGLGRRCGRPSAGVWKG